MSATHSGLHKLKAKKNHLAAQLGRFSKTLHSSVKFDHRPDLQSTVAHIKQTYRAMHIADCYMRGRAYAKVEPTRYTQPVWDLVAHFIDQHGGPIVVMPPLDEWALSNANA